MEGKNRLVKCEVANALVHKLWVKGMLTDEEVIKIKEKITDKICSA